MDNKQLIRLMGLARKTGSPLIVTDPEGDEPVVIMGIDQYEVLMGVDGFNANEFEKETAMEEYRDVLEDDDDVKIPGIEVIDDILNEESTEDDDFGEERFYLEPVE